MAKPKILVIDDEVNICQAIRRALPPDRFQVDTTISHEEGIQKILAGGCDLVLLDIMMPGVNGIDLIASIHEHDPEIVCIIITGYATVELAVRAIKEGAYDFLTKPFSVSDLLLAVNQGLERRKLSLEAKRAQEMEAEAQRLSEEKERLVELDRAKQQFIRLVTHELKAPVSAIQYYLKLMQEGYISPDEQAEIVRRCMARADEELALIGDLLELGRLQVVRPDSQTSVSLSDVLQEVIEEFQAEAEQRNIKVEILVEAVPPVLGSPDQFKSMWSNLLSNAVKYTLEGGRISVSLHANGPYVIGEVADTGIGIPLEEQDNLFTEFFRAKNVKDLEIQGTGLGLVIVKHVIERAGGEIEAESAPGHGSTFTFTLPAGE
ncbi:MAG: hybrid sensor histidine kinase/response regulator [Anaerolineae bacterium]|nr:hybrid sensor histidine kinase/response regulator [Anaerolineae bacterium]